MPRTFFSSVAPSAPLTQPASWFVFRGSQLIVRPEGRGVALPRAIALSTLGFAPVRTQYLGELDGEPYLAAELSEEAPLPEGWATEGLRALYGRLEEDLHALAGRAFQIIDWDRTHQFCGRCATPTEQLAAERAKKCPRCGLTAYPRVAPAIIVLIRRGREALLARGSRFPLPFYSTLAGFVEPGESLEEALAREVREEVGVEVKNLRYFGSQPWPYPHSLMVGFLAEYAGGELKLDPAEIIDAAWFSPDALPQIPPRLSIARKLIDVWLNEERGAPSAPRS